MTSYRVKLPYLLGALAWAKFEGTIELTEAEIQRTIIFHDGQPVNVWSALQEETLGRMLLEHNKISADDYSRLVDAMVETRKSTGQLLVSMGMLKAHEVFMALEYQAQRKFLNCLKMRRLRVVVKKKTVPPDSITLRMDLVKMLFAGILEGFSKQRLAKEFPIDSKTVFSVNRSSDPTLGLNPLQLKLYQAISKKPSLEELEGTFGSYHRLRVMLYGLHAVSLVNASGIQRPAMPGLVKLIGERGSSSKAAEPLKDTDACSQATRRASSHVSTRAQHQAFQDQELFPSLSMEDFFQARGVSPKLAEKVLTLPYTDHFAVLDIHTSATKDQIRDAFYQLVDTYRLHDPSSSYTSPGDLELAERLLDRATVAFRELSDSRSKAAYKKALQQNKTEKRTIQRRLLSEVKALKGELALGAGQYGKAKKLFSNAIDLYPVDPSCYHKLGLSVYLEFLGKYPDQPLPKQVREPFEEALRVDPSYAPSRLYLGKIMAQSGELVPAVQEFERILQAHPGHRQAEALWNRLKNLLAEERQEQE